MIPALIAKIGIPTLISIVSTALGKIDNAAAQEASKALGHVQATLGGGAVSPDQMEEANRHAEELAKLESDEYKTTLTQINESLRTEVSSADAYVQRMRPTFGYLMAITWAAQMLGLAYVVVFDTDKAPAVMESMDSLSTIWGVGLSVLGIYVYKRSEEKKKAASLSAAAKTLFPPKAEAGKPRVNE